MNCMTRSKTTGISDITSSESKLKRFTLLSKIIRSERSLNLRKIDRLAMEKIGSPFKNPNVTARHLAILQKIDLVEDMQGVYVLTGDGKALCELTPESDGSQSLTFGEKAIFLKNMFASVLRGQLLELLLVVQQDGTGNRKKIISAFFSTQLAANVWNSATIVKNLTKLNESGKIPTFFENKFTCIQRWLEDIGLLQRINGKICVTENGKIFLNQFQDAETSMSETWEILGKFLVSKTSSFDYSNHKEIFLETFRDACLRFKIDSGVSDIRAVQTFVCISLLKEGITISEATFRTIA